MAIERATQQITHLTQSHNMTLRIEAGKGLKAIQQGFNTLYPYLKIEFVNTIPYKEERKLPAETAIKIPLGIRSHSIDISSHKTVATIEKELKAETNLTAKIYRRFCNVWIETFLTSDWTLHQQNSEGKLLTELNSAMV